MRPEVYRRSATCMACCGPMLSAEEATFSSSTVFRPAQHITRWSLQASCACIVLWQRDQVEVLGQACGSCAHGADQGGKCTPWGLAVRLSLEVQDVTVALPVTRCWNTRAASMSNRRPLAHCSSTLHVKLLSRPCLTCAHHLCAQCTCDAGRTPALGCSHSCLEPGAGAAAGLPGIDHPCMPFEPTSVHAWQPVGGLSRKAQTGSL